MPLFARLLNSGAHLRRVASLVGMLALGMVLSVTLSACKNGSGSSGSEGGGDLVVDLLPDTQQFMPRSFQSVELEIDAQGSHQLHVTCLREGTPSDICVGGELATWAPCVLHTSQPTADESAEHSFVGRWEQQDSNSTNLIRALAIFQSERLGETDLVTELNILVSNREDDPHQTDETIILEGNATSGTLHLSPTKRISLIGATVRLTYTIAPGYVNEENHHTPAP